MAISKKMRKFSKKCKKNENAFWIASRHHFGDHFGSFWGLFGEPWGAKLGKRGVSKWIEKMIRKKVMQGISVNPENCQVRPYKQSFLEPRGLQGSLDCGL